MRIFFGVGGGKKKKKKGVDSSSENCGKKIPRESREKKKMGKLHGVRQEKPYPTHARVGSKKMENDLLFFTYPNKSEEDNY